MKSLHGNPFPNTMSEPQENRLMQGDPHPTDPDKVFYKMNANGSPYWVTREQIQKWKETARKKQRLKTVEKRRLNLSKRSFTSNLHKGILDLLSRKPPTYVSTYYNMPLSKVLQIQQENQL